MRMTSVMLGLPMAPYIHVIVDVGLGCSLWSEPGVTIYTGLPGYSGTLL